MTAFLFIIPALGSPKSAANRAIYELDPAAVSAGPRPASIALVGDSLTECNMYPLGASWPGTLQLRFRSTAIVRNFGVGGTTATSEANGADLDYRRTSEYKAARESRSDAVVIMLGTNDCKFWNWDR